MVLTFTKFWVMKNKIIVLLIFLTSVQYSCYAQAKPSIEQTKAWICQKLKDNVKDEKATLESFDLIMIDHYRDFYFIQDTLVIFYEITQIKGGTNSSFNIQARHLYIPLKQIRKCAIKTLKTVQEGTSNEKKYECLKFICNSNTIICFAEGNIPGYINGRINIGDSFEFPFDFSKENNIYERLRTAFKVLLKYYNVTEQAEAY